MQIIGRDNISQSGMKNKLKIDNRQQNNESLIKKIIIGILFSVVASVIAAGIIYWLGWK